MKQLLYLLVGVLFLTSCQDIWMDEVPENDQNQIVKDLCTEIGNNFVFFDEKEINWDRISAKYDSLSMQPMNNEDFFALLKNLLSELEDGHTSLYAGFNEFLYYDLFLKHESNFNYNFIQRQYLTDINEIGPFVFSKLNDDVGYLYYSSFGDDFTDDELKYLASYFETCSGLIIDIRDNKGGAADNISQIMKFMVTEKVHMGNLITRSNFNDKAEYLTKKIYIEPESDKPIFNQNMVVLTNRSCYSSCNVFAGFMQQLPNASIVGDTTGGGTGMAVGSVLANGWKYRYSAGEFTLADGTSFENGLTPDEWVITRAADEVNGMDLLIERALEILK